MTSTAFATQLDALEGKDFLEVAEWMKSTETKRLVADWLATHEMEVKNVKYVLALLYMTHESGTVLSDSQHDRRILAEATRFRQRLVRALTTDSSTIVTDVTRAVRFYKAWAAQDVPLQAQVVEETLARLMNEAMRQRMTDGTVPEDLVAQVRLLGGADAETTMRAQLERPWETVEGETNLQLRIRATAKRAMTDVLKAHVANGDYEALFDLLGQLQTGMTALATHQPRTQEDIADRFDAQWIRQQAEAGCLTPAAVHQFMRYLLETIGDFQAPVDTGRVETWRRDTEAVLHEHADMELPAFLASHLVDFLMTAVEHMETVVGRLMDLRHAMETND
jgi:hypothetical protein